MKWHKLGCIFEPIGSADWCASHAAVPCAEILDRDRVRVYFSSRDRQQRSFTGWFEVDPRRPERVTAVSPAPSLSPGPIGAFDDSGTMMTWVHAPRGYYYYIGWNRGVSVPFRNALGVAIREGEQLCKAFAGPILDRSIHDPCFVASACVVEEPAGWQMWYLSCVEWQQTPEGLRHRYHLKHATSADGLAWDRTGLVCIDFKDASEYAISRPSVVKDGDLYRMWFSSRGDTYRIRYAESRDGRRWERFDDRVGIDVSPAGWDSAMIEYPCVFDHEGSRYMLYNGNGYGATGIGLAILDQD